jgi:hypothetical protein
MPGQRVHLHAGVAEFAGQRNVVDANVGQHDEQM